MSRYYTGSKPFNWLRKKVFKIKKPVALGWGGWKKWDAELKSSRPVAFFFTETLPEWLEWLPDHTIEYATEVRTWLSNYMNGTHALHSTLKKGKWHEFDERLLYCTFDSFVDFIESETAGSHISWNAEDKAKYGVKWYHQFRILRGFKAWRCAKAGIDHLKWEMSLTEDGEVTHQAKSAFEKMTLYTWWKDIRPARKDAMIESGFGPWWDSMDEKYGEDSDWLGLGGKKITTTAEQQKYWELSAAKDKIEEQREEEDTEMLTRLIRIRKALWT